ncbi:DNA helicase mcm9 [Coemansia sp. RSA 2675]|nr:DNA helicase mcm9 [Coemansia sp. RSA 2675]
MSSSDVLDNVATVGAMQLFLECCYASELQALLHAPIDEPKALRVDFGRLLEFNVELANALLDNSDENLPLFHTALSRSLEKLSSTKEAAQVLVAQLPNHPGLRRAKMPRTGDAGRLVTVTGTVMRTGAAKLMDTQRLYACAKCGGRFAVAADVEQFGLIPAPTRCRAPGDAFCSSTAFAAVDDAGGARCVDWQEIKVQEHVGGTLGVGSVPRSMPVILEGALVDAAKSGDSVAVTGTLVRRWRAAAVGGRPDISLALRACSVRAGGGGVVGGDHRQAFGAFWREHARAPMAGRDAIVGGVCPQAHGLHLVKLATLLVLIGGVARAGGAGLRIRGEGHMLLVGDPGTAKSQFLRHAAALEPRAVLTTGVGSTSAGLTAAAVRDGGEWQLDAGALVQADGGVCCIDEFGDVREAEKGAVLEAMEQQSISVAKAGIVCRLSARCSVLAAMNPRGPYDDASSLVVNTALSSPLLSRFDLILVLRDVPDPAWDARVADFILGGKPVDARRGWGFDRLQAYVAYVRAALRPESTPASERVLTRYYQLQRSRDPAGSSRTTIRLLESLIRLAQAHARLMFRDKVLVEDAVTAVILMEATMNSASLLPSINPLRSHP